MASTTPSDASQGSLGPPTGYSVYALRLILVLVRYAKRNGDFVLVVRIAHASGGYLQADRLEQLVEVIDDALIELVELRTFLLLQAGVAGEGL